MSRRQKYQLFAYFLVDYLTSFRLQVFSPILMLIWRFVIDLKMWHFLLFYKVHVHYLSQTQCLLLNWCNLSLLTRRCCLFTMPANWAYVAVRRTLSLLKTTTTVRIPRNDDIDQIFSIYPWFWNPTHPQISFKMDEITCKWKLVT